MKRSSLSLPFTFVLVGAMFCSCHSTGAVEPTRLGVPATEWGRGALRVSEIAGEFAAVEAAYALEREPSADEQAAPTSPTSSEADESRSKAVPRKLESYEPNYIGYNQDKGLAGHMDFKVSLLYALSENSRPAANPNSTFWERLVPHVAFTARLSQYIESQDSSPVVGRRFNPEMFARMWGKQSRDYVDLGYGHESNGQNINSGPEFNAKAASLMADGDDPDFVSKFISRGWDYIGVTWRKGLIEKRQPKNKQVKDAKDFQLVMYTTGRYWLDTGFLQGESEEFFQFEGGRPRERSQFDGLRFLLRADIDRGWGWKVAALFVTGYKDAFRNNTVRLEVTCKKVPFKIFDVALPIMIWGQTGYNADLATYFENSVSFGIGLELE